jgi:NADH-quinone oxidoreductase subunit J
MTLFYQFLFYLFGLIAIASALLFVTRRSPVAAALWLVSVMISLAAMYVMMGAHFVGAVQVIIYAGAIMVVFLFVVMLLNLGHAEAVADIRSKGWRLGAGALGLVLLALLLTMAREPLPRLAVQAPRHANAVTPVAEALYRDYVLAFEAASILLLAAIVASVVLAKRAQPRS